jgi:hypothetical protein
MRELRRFAQVRGELTETRRRQVFWLTDRSTSRAFSSTSREWPMRRSSPFTAAGPRWIRTTFPLCLLRRRPAPSSIQLSIAGMPADQPSMAGGVCTARGATSSPPRRAAGSCLTANLRKTVELGGSGGVACTMCPWKFAVAIKKTGPRHLPTARPLLPLHSSNPPGKPFPRSRPRSECRGHVGRPAPATRCWVTHTKDNPQVE